MVYTVKFLTGKTKNIEVDPIPVFKEDIDELIDSGYLGVTIKRGKRDVENIVFRDKKLVSADFSGLSMFNIRFENCDLSYASFKGCDLMDLYFDNCKLENVNFSESVIDGCFLYGEVLTGCSFALASFEDVTLQYSILNNCDFGGIKLRWPESPGRCIRLMGATLNRVIGNIASVDIFGSKLVCGFGCVSFNNSTWSFDDWFEKGEEWLKMSMSIDNLSEGQIKTIMELSKTLVSNIS